MSFINELDEIENDPRYAQLAPDIRTAVLDNWEKAASSGKTGVEAEAASSAARTLLEARQSKLKARLPASPLGTLADVPPPLAALTSDPRWGTLDPTVRKQTIDNWAGAKAQTAIAAGFRPSEAVSTYQEIVQGQVMAEAPEKPDEAFQARLAADTKEVFDIAKDPAIRAGGFRAGKVGDKFVVNPALALAGEDEYAKAVDEADATPVEKIRAKALYGAGRATSLASMLDITRSAVSDSRPMEKTAVEKLQGDVEQLVQLIPNLLAGKGVPGGSANSVPTVIIGGKTVDFEDAAEIAFTPSRAAMYDKKGATQESLLSTDEGVRKAAEIRTAQQLATHVLPLIGADAAAARVLDNPEGPEAKALVEAHRDNLKRELWVKAGNIDNNVFEKGRMLSDGTPVFNPNWARSNPDPKDVEDMVQKVGITASVEDVKASIKDEARASASRLVLRAGLEDQTSARPASLLPSLATISPLTAELSDIGANALPEKFRDYVAAKQKAGETDPLVIVDGYEKKYGMLTDDVSIGLRKAVAQTKSIAAGVSGILGTAAEQFGGANPASKFLSGLAADIVKETAEAEQLQSELTGSNAGFGSTVTQSVTTELPFMVGGLLAGRAASAARYAAVRSATPEVIAASLSRKMGIAASMTPELAASADALVNSGSGILKTYFGLQASRSFGGVYASTYTAQKERALRMGKTEEEADRDARVTSILPSIAGGVATAVLMKMFPGGTEEAMRSLATKESVEAVLARAGSTVGTKAGNNVIVNAFRNVQALRSTRDFARTYFSQDTLKRVGLKTFAGMADEALEETVDEAFQGMLGSMYDERMTLQDVVGNALQAGGIGALIGGGSTGIASYKENLKVIRNARKNKPVSPDVAPTIADLEANGDTATAEALRRAAAAPDNFQVALDKLNAVDETSGKGRFAFAFDSNADAEDELPTASYVVGTPDPDPVKAAANMAATVATIEAAIAADPDLKDVLSVSADAANGRVIVSPSISAVASWAAAATAPAKPVEAPVGDIKAQVIAWVAANLPKAEAMNDKDFALATAALETAETAWKKSTDKFTNEQRQAALAKRETQEWNAEVNKMDPAVGARVRASRTKFLAWEEAVARRNEVLNKLVGGMPQKAPKTPKAKAAPEAAPGAAPAPAEVDIDPAVPVSDADIEKGVTASSKTTYDMANDDPRWKGVDALIAEATDILKRTAAAINKKAADLRAKGQLTPSLLETYRKWYADLEQAVRDSKWTTANGLLKKLREKLNDDSLIFKTRHSEVMAAPKAAPPTPEPKSTTPKPEKEKPVVPPLESMDDVVLPEGATEEDTALLGKIKGAITAFPERARGTANDIVVKLKSYLSGVTDLAVARERLRAVAVEIRGAARKWTNTTTANADREVVAKAAGFGSFAEMDSKAPGWKGNTTPKVRAASSNAKAKAKARAAAGPVEAAPDSTPDAAPAVVKKPARQRAAPPAPKPETSIPDDWRLRTGPELMAELRAALRRDPRWEDVLYSVSADLKTRVMTKVAESSSDAQSKAKFEALRLANHVKIVAALDTEEDPDAEAGKLEIPAEDREKPSERTPAEVAVALGTSAESGAEATFVGTTPSSVAKKVYDKLQPGILSEFTWKVYWWTLGRQMARSTTDEQKAKIRARASRLFDAIQENGIWQKLEGRKEEFLYALENPLTKAPGEVSAITTARLILTKKIGELKGLLVNTAKKRIVSGSTTNQTANENAQSSGEGVIALLPAAGSMNRKQLIDAATADFIELAARDLGVREEELSDKLLASAGREFALRRIAMIEEKAWTGNPDSVGAKNLARVVSVAEGDELRRIADQLGTREAETRPEELEAVRTAFDDALAALGGDVTTNLSGVLGRIAADKGNPLSELAGILLKANAASYVAGVTIIDDPTKGPAFYDPDERTITFNRAAASTRGFTDDIVHEVLHAATDSFLSTVHPEGSPEAAIVQRILDLQNAVLQRFKAAAPSWKEALGSETILESGFFADLVALRASTLLDSDKRAWLEENAVEGYEAGMTEDAVADLFLEASIKDASARRDGLVEILRDFEYALGESGTPEYYPSGISKEFITLMYTSPVFQEAVQNAPELNAQDAEGTFKKFVRAVRSFVGTLIKGKTTAPAKVPDYSVLRDLLAAQGEVRPVSTRRPVAAAPAAAPAPTPTAASEPEASSKLRRLYDNGTLVPLTGIPRRRRPDLGGEAGWNGLALEMDGRVLVIAKVGTLNVPFYKSSGQAKKDGVSKGKWYPVFGADPKTGWINKTTSGTGGGMANYFGMPELKAVAEILDSQLGDIEVFEGSGTVPLVQSVSPSATNPYDENTGKDPIDSRALDAFNKLHTFSDLVTPNNAPGTTKSIEAAVARLLGAPAAAAPAPLAVVRKVANFSVPPLYRTREFTSVFGQAIDRAVAAAGFSRDFSQVIIEVEATELEREAKAEDEAVASLAPVTRIEEAGNLASLPDEATVEDITEAAPRTAAASVALAAVYKEFGAWSAAVKRRLGAAMGRFARTMWNGLKAVAAIGLAASMYMGPLSPDTSAEGNPTESQLQEELTQDELVAASVSVGAVTQPNATPATETRPAPEITDVEFSQGFRTGATASLNKVDFQKTHYVQFGDEVNQMALEATPLTPAMKSLASLMGQKEGTRATGPNRLLAPIFRHGGVRGSQDEIPWCAMSVSYALTKAGAPTHNVFASQFLSTGKRVDTPQVGDVVVFNKRNEKDNSIDTGTAGHVGFFMADLGNYILVLDGNVEDKVAITAISKRRFMQYRRITTPGTRAPFTVTLSQGAANRMAAGFATEDDILEAQEQIQGVIEDEHAAFWGTAPQVLGTRTRIPAARLRGDQISLSSELSPVERVWKTEHELGHWLYRDTSYRESFTRLWASLTDDERRTIDAEVTALYSAEEVDEERQVRALELVRRNAAGKSAWKKFTDAVASLWKKITGSRHENPEELAARMVAVARHEVFVLRRVMPEIVDAINLSTTEDGAAKDSGDRYSLANRVRGTSDTSDLAFLNQNASWVDEYDRANPKNKDSSDALASEYLRTALDRVVESTGQSSREANTVLTNLRKDKVSEALTYFDGNPGYRPVEAAAVVGVLLRKRIDWLAQSEDAQGNVLPGGLRSQKIDPGNEHIGSAFNAAIAAGAVRGIRQGTRPDKAYEAAVEDFAKADKAGGRKTGRRGWVSYEAGSDATVLESDTAGSAGRWCIGSGAASGYLSRGGFEIFFDDDGRARVAIHHSDGGINEISGSFGDQNLRDGEGEIAVAKAEEIGLRGTEDILADIDRKRRFMASRNGGTIDEDLLYVDAQTGEFVWDTDRRHQRYGSTPLFETTQEDVARLKDYMSSLGLDSAAFLERAAMSGDIPRVKKAARHPLTPAGVLTDLSEDPSQAVRYEVAYNPSTPASVLVKLAGDSRADVRVAVAQNSSTPASALGILAEDQRGYVRAAVAENTSTPASVLVKLAGDEDSTVRADVAQNSSTPASALGILAEDIDDYVQKQVARNSSAPASALEKLAGNEDPTVRREVAKNPSTPASALDILADDPEDYVQKQVAYNPSTPASALEKLVGIPDMFARLRVAKNPLTPASALEKLAGDKSPYVRSEVAQRPSTPASALEKLAGDEDSGVLYAVIRHASTPASALEKLAGNPDYFVSYRARETLLERGTTPRVLGTRRRESPVRRLPQALRDALPEDEIQDIEDMYNVATGSSHQSPFTLDDAIYAGRPTRMALTWLLNEDLRRLISSGNANEGARAADLSHALAVLTESGGDVAGKSVTEIYDMQTAPGLREASLKAFIPLGLTVKSRIASTPGFFTPRALRIDSKFHATTNALSAARNIFASVAGTASPDTLTWKLMTARDPAKILSLVPEASRPALEAARAALRSNYAEISGKSLATLTGMPELWDLASRLEALKEAAVNPAATADSRGMMIPRLAAVLKEAGLDAAEILPVRQQMATYKDDAARFSNTVSEAARTAVNRFAMGRKLSAARLEFLSAGSEALAFRDKAQGLVYKIKLPQRMGADTGFSFDVAPPTAAPEEGEVLFNLTEGLGRSPLWQELNEMHTAVPGIVDHEVVGFTDFGALITVQKDVRGQSYSPSEDAGVIEEWMEVTGARRIPAGRLYSEDFARDATSNAFSVVDSAGFTRILADVRPANASVLNGAFLLFDPAISPAVEGEAKGMLGTRRREAVQGMASRLAEWARTDVDDEIRQTTFVNPITGERDTFADVVTDFSEGMDDGAALEYVRWLQSIPDKSEMARDIVADIVWAARIPATPAESTVLGTRARERAATPDELIRRFNLTYDTLSASEKVVYDKVDRQTFLRNPWLAVLARRMREGQISAGEYADAAELVDPFVVKGPEETPSYASIRKYMAMSKPTPTPEKLSRIGAAVPEGTVYEFRIDIPTYNASAEAGDEVYTIAVHEAVPEGATRVGDVVSYIGIAKVLNPTFMTRAISGKGDASMIAAGSGKTPLATVKGIYQSISQVPADITDANVWTEVGYNPIRSSYFVDVRSKQAVVGGSEAIMIGPRVFVKDAVLEPRNRDAVPGGRADDNKMRVLYTRARSSRRTIPIVSSLLSIGKDKVTRNKEVEAALGITRMSRWVSEKGKWGDLYKVQKELENNVQRAVTLSETLFSALTSRMNRAGLNSRDMTAQQKRQAEDVNTVLGTIATLRDEQAAQAAEKERSRERRRTAFGVAQRRKLADQMTAANRATELVSIATEANVSYARIETAYQDAILEAERTATQAFVQKQAEAAQRLRADNLVPVLEAAQNLRNHLNDLSQKIQATTGADSRIRAHYNARFGIHLSRYYEIHDNPAYASWLWSNDPEAVKVRNAGLNWIRNARATKFAADLKSRMRGATNQEIERAAKDLASKLDNSGLMLELEDIIQKHMNRGGVGGVGMPGLLNGSILMERMNVPPELRTLLGEYKDNVAVAARTALEMGVYYANYVYLDGVRVELQTRQNERDARITELQNKISSAKPLTTEEDAELTRLKRTMFITHDPVLAKEYGLELFIPDTTMINKAAFGPLQGFYGPPITVEAMRDLEGGGGTNAILNGYAELLGITMKSFTVWNLRGQARNFLSSIAFIPASGHLSMPVWRQSGLSGDNKASALFKQFGALGNARLKDRIEAVGLEKAMAEFTDMYVKRGIVGGSDAAVFREEMRKVAGKDYGAAISRVLSQYNASAATVTTAAVPFAEVFKTIDRFMTEVHRGSDDYFKKILFELEYAARLEEFGVKIEKGLPVMTDKAARRIIQVYGDKALLTPSNIAEVGSDEKAKALLLMEVVSAEATFSKIPYYNRLPEVVNAFKRQKLGLASAPFISWPAAIWSQPYKAFKTFQQDRAVPETRDRAAKTAIAYGATAIGWSTFVGTTLSAIVWAIAQLGFGDEDKKIRPVFGVNSDQSRALQDFLNKDFYKYRSIALLGMRGDNPVWADVSWMNPWSTITDVGTPFFHPRALESGTDFSDAMKASIDKVLKTVLSPQIPISNAFDTLTADDFRTKNASFGEKLLKVAGAVAAPLVPMTLKDMSKVYYAAGTERFATEAVSTVLGLKINETDIRDVLAKTARSVAAQDSDTMDRYRRLLTNGRADDIGKLEDTYQEGMDDMRRLYLDLYQKMSSAAVFIPAADANKIIREEGKGLGFARLAELEKGVLSGWKPGQTTLERAARMAQKEGGDDRVRKASELVEQYGVQSLR